MTVNSSVSDAVYQGDGASVTFPVPFYFLDNTHLSVVLVNEDTLVETELVLDSDYSVSGAGVQAGGSITMVTAPATNQKLLVFRDVPIDQQIDYVQNDKFPAQVTEDGLDKLTMIAQQLATTNTRSIRYPISEFGVDGTLPIAPSRANNLLGFDPLGQQIMVPIPASVGAGDLKNETWTAGIDFVKNTSTSVNLSRPYGNKANLGTVVMDGLAQDPSTYSLTGGGLTLQFNAPIPADRVWCVGGTTLSLMIPAIQSIIDAMVAPGSKLSNRIGDTVSVTDFPGCDKTGVSDSTAAFLAAKAAIEATGKAGTVMIPPGDFLISGTLGNDRSANAAVPVVSWIGAGSGSTRITYTGNSILFNPVGNAASASFYGKYSGMTLLGTGLANTFAFGPTLCSFFRFSDLHIEGFDYAFYGQDIDHTLYDNVIARFNKKGFFARQNPTPVASSTCPNQLTFLQCTFGSNSDFAVDLEQGAGNNFVGCQFEFNGTGGPSGFGVQNNGSSLQGGPALIFTGCYFESNNGVADVVLTSITPNLNPPISDATYIFNGCNFNRVSNMFMAGASILTNFGDPAVVGQQIVVLNGCTFKGFNSYVPNAGRPYINYAGVATRTKNNFFTTGCVFQSAIEAPTAVQNPAKSYLQAGKAASQSIPNNAQTTWAIDAVQSGYSWSTAISGGGITIPETGVYLIACTLTFTSALANTTQMNIFDGATVIATEAVPGGQQVISCSTMKLLTAGDVIGVTVTQTSGGNQTLAGGPVSFLTVTKMVDA